jgi:hypothetical protein
MGQSSHFVFLNVALPEIKFPYEMSYGQPKSIINHPLNNGPFSYNYISALQFVFT